MGGLVKVGPAKKEKKYRKQRHEHNEGRCHYCRCCFEPQTRTSKHHETVDHKHPTSRGGTNSRDNKVRCCWLCNNRKGNMTEAEFMRYLATGVKSPMGMLNGRLLSQSAEHRDHITEQTS